MKLVSPLGIAAILSGDTKPYYQKSIGIVGAPGIISYWPGWETAGTVIGDASGNNRVGSYSGGITLNQTGIGDGKGAAQYDGAANTRGNIYSTSFRDAFNGAEGFVNAWLLLPAAAWTDSKIRYGVVLGADAQNQILIYKALANNTIVARYRAGNVLKGATVDDYEFSINPIMVTIVWSKSGDYVRAYYQGKKVGADLTSLGTWAGALASAGTFLGQDYTGSASVWSGQLPHVMVGNAPITDAQVAALFSARSTPKRVTIIGDSISANNTIPGWNYRLVDQYKNGAVWMINHAVAGNSIMANMATQTAAAATDNAEIIIIELGTNDSDNAGITAEYTANLNALKLSNPGTTIYGMGILNKTTPGARDANNVRISTACSDAGVNFWDTEGWIDPATDTSDGLHLNAAGSQKVVTQAIARLP